MARHPPGASWRSGSSGNLSSWPCEILPSDPRLFVWVTAGLAEPLGAMARGPGAWLSTAGAPLGCGPIAVVTSGRTMDAGRLPAGGLHPAPVSYTHLRAHETR